MPDIGTVDDLRPLVGSAAFIPALLSFIRNSSSGNLPLDPALFQAILLCMVAGGKHLILHTPEEDVGLVVKLAVWELQINLALWSHLLILAARRLYIATLRSIGDLVMSSATLTPAVQTLSSIFDLPTHKVKIRSRAAPTVRSSGDIAPPRDPNLFLRSLFLQSNCSDDSDHSRPASHSRNRARKQRPSYLHSASFPNDLSMLGNRSLGVDHSVLKVDKEPQKTMLESVSPPLVIASPQPRHFAQAHTDSAPLRGGSVRPEFPHALVMSGLDHANMAEQMSLAHALTERLVIIEALKHEAGHNGPRPRGLSSGTHESDPRRKDSPALLEDSGFEGTWNVPDDFILIYVCPWDARERPKIHKTLLDRFAISSTIFVSQHIRQSLRALPFTSNPIPHSRLLSLSHSSPPTPAPLQPRPSAPQSRTPPALTRALPVTNHPPHCNSSHPSPPPPPTLVPKQLIPREFLIFLQGAAELANLSSNLSLYLSDLFSAVRHHPKLDGTFLTARALNDARALARAGRIFGTDPTGGELLRDHYGIEIYDDDEGYEEDESQTSFKEYNNNDVASGSGSVTINIPRGITPSPLPSREGGGSTTKGHDPTPTLAGEPPDHDPLGTLSVSEADIARIFPRVVTHRLRVRDGPEDEVLASAIFGATFEDTDTVKNSKAAPEYGWDMRSTVKDVLVEVLAEV